MAIAVNDLMQIALLPFHRMPFDVMYSLRIYVALWNNTWLNILVQGFRNKRSRKEDRLFLDRTTVSVYDEIRQKIVVKREINEEKNPRRNFDGRVFRHRGRENRNFSWENQAN